LRRNDGSNGTRCSAMQISFSLVGKSLLLFLNNPQLKEHSSLLGRQSCNVDKKNSRSHPHVEQNNCITLSPGQQCAHYEARKSGWKISYPGLLPALSSPTEHCYWMSPTAHTAPLEIVVNQCSRSGYSRTVRDMAAMYHGCIEGCET
jgi:hypothetical protein